MTIKKIVKKKVKDNSKLYVIISTMYSFLRLINLWIKVNVIHHNAAILTLTPTHGNLGDHAIAYAIQRVLVRTPNKYIELVDRDLYLLKKYKMLGLMNKHDIIINGGGNLGTLWWDVEEMIRSIIINNSKSHIIIMPSTVFYDDNDLLIKSKDIYNNHPNLTIYTREIYSYNLIKDLYRDVRLAPDMVFSLKYHCKTERKGALLCFRADREKTISDNKVAMLKSIAEEVCDGRVSVTDTVLHNTIEINERKEALKTKFKEFSKAKIVITDRLHGMIFAAITSTPCIVVGSRSYKLQGCFEWIKNQGFIRIVDSDDSETLKQEMLQLSSLDEVKYTNAFFDDYKFDFYNTIGRGN